MKARRHHEFKKDNSNVLLLSTKRNDKTIYIVKNKTQIWEFLYYRDALCEFYKEICHEQGSFDYILSVDEYIEIDSE
jgi:hypothetical protein